MSENRVEGSSQAVKAHGARDAQSLRQQVDSHPTPHTLEQRAIREKTFTPLLEKMMELQQLLRDHITQLTARQMHGLSLEEEQCTRAFQEREDRIGHLLGQMISFMWSEVVKQLFLSRDSRDAATAGQRTLSSWQPDWPGPWLIGFNGLVLSKRGIDISEFYCLNFHSYEACQKDKYHKEKNPLGFLNLGSSENMLCMDLMMERLCQHDMNCIDEALLQYPDWRGHPFLREEVAQFLTTYCKAPTRLDSENVVVLNDCCSVFSSLAMVLCDVGDACLIPTPCSGSFAFSSYLYAKVELIPVPLESEVTEANPEPFQLTVDKLEFALIQARKKGKKVRGLVLINPQNPLGDVYSRETLQEYLVFAKKYNLHVIIDEIYMLSVFDESVTFCSVLSIKHLPDPDRTHVIWGTSKDFGISGFRLGVLYTHNKEVVSAMSSFGYLHGVSGIIQYKLCRLLRDREWIDKVYLPTNHRRLQEAHKYITKKLEEMEVPFLNGGSGLSVWINLKGYLDPCTFEEELILHRRFLDSKLMLSSGKSYMCKEPGWFCLIFSENHIQLKVAMDRFCEVLREQKEDWIKKQLEDAMRPFSDAVVEQGMVVILSDTH